MKWKFRTTFRQKSAKRSTSTKDEVFCFFEGIQKNEWSDEFPLIRKLWIIQKLLTSFFQMFKQGMRQRQMTWIVFLSLFLQHTHARTLTLQHTLKTIEAHALSLSLPLSLTHTQDHTRNNTLTLTLRHFKLAGIKLVKAEIKIPRRGLLSNESDYGPIKRSGAHEQIEQKNSSLSSTSL